MNEEEYYPLLAGAEYGDVAAVERFLQTPGIDVDFTFDPRDDEGISTPLNWFIRHNQEAIVEVLLAHGAAVNGAVGTWKTPLQMACDDDYANKDIVKVLLEHGAEVDAMAANDRLTPLSYACKY